MNIPYIQEYANRSSYECKKIEAEIKDLLLNVTQNKGVVGVQVSSLTNGSVIVKATLGLVNASIDTYPIMQAINDAISNGELSSLNATGVVAVDG